jgi:hypothetical protein
VNCVPDFDNPTGPEKLWIREVIIMGRRQLKIVCHDYKLARPIFTMYRDLQISRAVVITNQNFMS